ncbi:nuclear transport factor 2 family protein [Nocardia sp. NPDC127526]|uniref:nuclear transport factor 2 family protein n=1 Tax=Nocardia sp. NPDC127526 TaxID=3345393 RepID=UPI003627A56B
MTAPTAALQLARAYWEAWTGHDVDKALTYIAPDVVCDTPGGRIEGVDAFRGFLAPFVETLQRAELLAAYGDDTTALIMYDTVTPLVAHAPAAELVTIENGLITKSRFIFDRLPFETARAALGEG